MARQRRWLAVVEEPGGPTQQMPIPDRFGRSKEGGGFGRAFSTAVDGIDPPQSRRSGGPSLDGKGEFRTMRLRAMGEEPRFASPVPQAFAQLEEMRGGQERVAAKGTSSQGVDAAARAAPSARKAPARASTPTALRRWPTGSPAGAARWAAAD